MSSRRGSLALGMAHPYRDTIQAAMKHVFISLDLPWVVGRSQAAATLLALFGGMFGLHHFHLGNRSRGYKYLAFCWTAVPILLGVFDSARLARLGAAEFREKYPDRVEVVRGEDVSHPAGKDPARGAPEAGGRSLPDIGYNPALNVP